MVATPKGGQAPIDPKSEDSDAQTPATERYYQDQEVQQVIADTHKLSEQKAEDFDAVFYPGGHGPLWDLSEDSDKPVAAVCHAPGVFKNIKLENGEPLVKGKKVTGFSNTEEEAVQLTEVVPFLLEEEEKNAGGD